MVAFPVKELNFDRDFLKAWIRPKRMMFVMFVPRIIKILVLVFVLLMLGTAVLGLLEKQFNPHFEERFVRR
jgi:hypothetical protein